MKDFSLFENFDRNSRRELDTRFSAINNNLKSTIANNASNVMNNTNLTVANSVNPLKEKVNNANRNLNQLENKVNNLSNSNNELHTDLSSALVAIQTTQNAATALINVNKDIVTQNNNNSIVNTVSSENVGNTVSSDSVGNTVSSDSVATFINMKESMLSSKNRFTTEDKNNIYYLTSIQNQNKSLNDNIAFLGGSYSSDNQKFLYEKQHILYWVSVNFWLFYIYMFLAVVYGLIYFLYDKEESLGFKIFWYLHVLFYPYLIIYTELATFLFLSYVYCWSVGQPFTVWKYFTSFPSIV